MKDSKALQQLEDSCVFVNGVKTLSTQKLQDNGLLPKPKNDDEYLNQCSQALTEPLHLLDYPVLYTSTCKKSESFEKTITSCAISTADLENIIIGQTQATIQLVNEHNVNTQPVGNYHKIKAFLERGEECVADIIFANKSLTLPVDSKASFAEIALKASFRCPGHAYVFTNTKDALDFYSENFYFYTLAKREQFLEQVELFAKMKDQHDSYINTRIKHEMLKVLDSQPH